MTGNLTWALDLMTWPILESWKSVCHSETLIFLAICTQFWSYVHINDIQLKIYSNQVYYVLGVGFVTWFKITAYWATCQVMQVVKTCQNRLWDHLWLDIGVAEFKSTRHRKNKSRFPPRENSSRSLTFFSSEVTTDFGKLKIVHEAMHLAYSKVFRW